MNEQQTINLYRAFFVIGDSTNLKILQELSSHGERTFSQLRDNLRINPSTLTKKLRLMMQFELVASDKTHDHLRVFYSLHKHQRELKKILESIERFSQVI
jgi:DNA-binding HxlR family transcriptional regulator